MRMEYDNDIDYGDGLDAVKLGHVASPLDGTGRDSNMSSPSDETGGEFFNGCRRYDRKSLEVLIWDR
jgi:hypothetical protein